MTNSILSQLSEAAEELIGTTVPRPSGQLAGHAGGLPFENLLEAKLEEKFPNRAYRQFKALNEHLLSVGYNANDTATALRFGSESINFLVSRGKQALAQWSSTKQFEEKQNDTAESIVFSEKGKFFSSSWVSLIDVKSQRTDRKAQPPNIISAKKVKDLALKALIDDSPINFEILYAGIQYTPTVENGIEVLRCTNTRCIDLMKVLPNSKQLYINWAAAMQIQFHPAEVNQDFDGSKREWFIGYLHNYANSLEHRVKTQLGEVEQIREFLSTIQS